MSRTTAISAEMITKIRLLRRFQKVSAQDLAERITGLGYSISRAQLANYESGRIDTVPVDFVFLAAEALGTTAIQLITDPVQCPTCKGRPPAGFTCNTCQQSTPTE